MTARTSERSTNQRELGMKTPRAAKVLQITRDEEAREEEDEERAKTKTGDISKKGRAGGRGGD